MKKQIFIFLILILLMQSALAVETVFKGEEVRIDLVKISPSPIKPGEVFDIWFDVTNIESYTLKNIDFTISAAFPFSLNEGLGTVKIYELKPGEKASLKYNLKVNANADEGTYNVGLQFLSPKSGQVVSSKFDLDVVRSKVISATNIKVEPEMVQQGDSAKVIFTLENTADSALTDVKVKLDLSGDLPFAPRGSTTERDISLLAPGQKMEINFDIVALPKADSGIYKIPITMTYYDDAGKEYTKSNIFGITIGSAPDLSFFIEETTLHSQGGKVGTITIKIVNKGLSDVKFLNLNLDDTNDFEVISPNQVYVGSVDSDDYETAEYKVKVKRTRGGKVSFPLKIDYRDANNNKYNRIEELVLKLRSPSELGLSGGSNLGLILFIIIILGLYLYRYRKWKKTNKGGLKEYTKLIYLKFKTLLSKIRKKNKS